MKKDAGHHNQRLCSHRQYRCLRELMEEPRTVRELFNSAGANGIPQLVASLRAKGLKIDTEERKGHDRDQKPVTFKVYVLRPESRALATRLLSNFSE